MKLAASRPTAVTRGSTTPLSWHRKWAIGTQWLQAWLALSAMLLPAAGKPLEAPIKDFPDFEQLEFKGRNLKYLDPFLAAMKSLTVQTLLVQNQTP
jgi:hypothetical protein